MIIRVNSWIFRLLILKPIKAVVEALAKMHEADPTKIGLESYGKLDGYLKRNET